MADVRPPYLYLLAEDLYRLGNATTSKLDNVRPRDVDTYDHNGIAMVRSNGKGISLITETRLLRLPRGSGYAWKIPAHFPMPSGLALKADMKDVPLGGQSEHYLLCPERDMVFTEYTFLLSKFASSLERTKKI